MSKTGAVSKTSAVLLCDARTGALKIAGLTVLDRLVITAHRAGCAPIVWAGASAPPVDRAEELGIQISPAAEAAASAEPLLLIEGSVLVEVRDLENVIAHQGQLVSATGQWLPVRMKVENPRPIAAGKVATVITDAASAAEAEGKFWASLTSTADGFVDRFFNRPLGRPFSKLLVHTPVTPNQVSVVSILIGVASAWFFAAGNFLAGALIFQLCAIIDCVDGDLARALWKQSRLGKWLDLGGDQVVHFSVFAAIGIGVARNNPSLPALALGASAALGVLLSFAVIVRALRRPATQRSPLLNRFLDATANRDFSVLLLVLALWGRIDLFLWMAGIGIHLFWFALFALQVARVSPAVSREPA